MTRARGSPWNLLIHCIPPSLFSFTKEVSWSQTTMASLTKFLCPLFSLLATSFIRVFAFQISIKTTYLAPVSCSEKIRTCTASLYHISHGFRLEEMASFYSVISSQIKPIMYGTKQDYLITVPCSCKNTTDLSGYYFYDTTYKVRQGDIFVNISNLIYSGQALLVNGTLYPDENLPIHIPCGCSENEAQRVVTYTVQPNDTAETISLLLNATLPAMLSMNTILAQNPAFIDVGWVLYVPLELNGVPPPPRESKLSASTAPWFHYAWYILF